MNPVVSCEHCSHVFEADVKLVGGYASCPGCGRATPVEGLRDPLWRLWQVGVFVAVVLGAGVVGATLGAAPAAGVLVAGLGLAYLVTRVFF